MTHTTRRKIRTLPYASLIRYASVIRMAITFSEERRDAREGYGDLVSGLRARKTLARLTERLAFAESVLDARR